jgi:hypothetical protein
VRLATSDPIGERLTGNAEFVRDLDRMSTFAGYRLPIQPQAPPAKGVI